MYSLSVLIFPKFRVNEVEKITVVFTRCEATFFFGGGGVASVLGHDRSCLKGDGN